MQDIVDDSFKGRGVSVILKEGAVNLILKSSLVIPIQPFPPNLDLLVQSQHPDGLCYGGFRRYIVSPLLVPSPCMMEKVL